MLDGIEQPGDRRLLKDIAETPQASADAWRDGYEYGKKQWKVCGYVEGMHQAARLLIDDRLEHRKDSLHWGRRWKRQHHHACGMVPVPERQSPEASLCHSDPQRFYASISHCLHVASASGATYFTSF